MGFWMRGRNEVVIPMGKSRYPRKPSRSFDKSLDRHPICGKLDPPTPLNAPPHATTGSGSGPDLLRKRKLGHMYLHRRNFIGGFSRASDILMAPFKTTVWNFSCEGQNTVFVAS